MDLDSLLRDTLRSLLRELAQGPPSDMAFIVNPGDRGLIASLAAMSAEEASRRQGGRSSVSAHTQHLRFGFHLLNQWIRGDQNAFANADFAESWSHQQVTDEEWRGLVQSLEQEVQAWSEAMATPREWDPITLSGAVSSVAHTAYHMGAIRQLALGAAGPREGER